MLSDITKTLIHFSYSFPENVIDLLTKTIQKISKKKDFISSLKDYCELVKDKRENIYPIALKEMFELVNKKIESKVFKIDEAFYNELTQQILIPLSNFLQSTQSGKVLKLLIEQILSLMLNQKIFMKTNFVNLLQVVKTMSIDHEEVMATTGINCLGLLIHQSNFDIPLLMSSINVPKGFIAKKELEKVPIISTWMKYIKCIFMDRSNLRKSAESIVEGIKLLKGGYSMVIFPEGTRSKDNKVHDFMPGCFKIATLSKCPVVVCSIDGTQNIHKNFPWKKTNVTIKMLEVLPADYVAQKKTIELSQQTYNIIKSDLEADFTPLQEPFSKN